MIRALAAPAAAILAMTPAAVAADDSESCDAWAATPAAWDEVERALRANYAYLDRVDDPDALLARAGEAARLAGTIGELARLTETLGYAFRDGHFHIRPVSAPERAWIPSSSDFWVARSDGRWIVSDVRQRSDAAGSGIRPGWEVRKMGDESIEAAARAALAPVVDEPSPAQLEYAANVVLTGFLGQARSFTFESPDGRRTLDLQPAQQSLGERPDTGLTVFEHDGIARIRFNNSLGDNAMIEAFDRAISNAQDARGLIIDLRDTPGGGNTTVARAILGHFVDKPAIYQVHRNAYEEAVFGVRRQYAEYVFPRGDRFTGPVAVLAGRWTGSVGEALAMAFDRTVGAETIGSPLADLLGTLNNSETENGCLRFAFAWDRLMAADLSAREDWEPATRIEAADTAADGSDAALAAALTWMDGERSE